jgi:hypothetical protein
VKKKILRIRGVAQAAEHLLCKHKALSSNHSPARQTNKQKILRCPSLGMERMEGRRDS